MVIQCAIFTTLPSVSFSCPYPSLGIFFVSFCLIHHFILMTTSCRSPSTSSSHMITALDQDDERILKVLKKITDSISLPNLMKTKTFLLSVVQSLAFTPSLCSIIISTLFSISKSIAKSSMTNSKGLKGQ